MRILLLAVAMAGSLASLAGCVGNDAAAVQAMNNQPNTCGPGGTARIEDCRGHP